MRMNIVERTVEYPFTPSEHKILARYISIPDIIYHHPWHTTHWYFAQSGELVTITANKPSPKLELDDLTIESMIHQTKNQYPELPVDNTLTIWVDIYTGPQPPKEVSEKSYSCSVA
jgi:hypothetical protein